MMYMLAMLFKYGLTRGWSSLAAHYLLPWLVRFRVLNVEYSLILDDSSLTIGAYFLASFSAWTWTVSHNYNPGLYVLRISSIATQRSRTIGRYWICSLTAEILANITKH